MATSAPTSPTPLSNQRSFGFGDRIGLAGPGHLRALQASGFAPILAQQSVRELDRLGRTAADVMDAAKRAIAREGYTGPWGGDADHLKTVEAAQQYAQAGFTFFTIDPSDHLGAPDRVQSLPEAYADLYLGQSWETASGQYSFDEAGLKEVVSKFEGVLDHCEMMAKGIAAACAGRGFEIEVSVDEAPATTSPLDHLFVALELKRRGVSFASLAPRFVGSFQKGIDYRGDLKTFESDLQQHVDIARQVGPYKLSIHSGSDKFSIYPIIGRLCGEWLHVKTSGTSYLEALRVLCVEEKALFRELLTVAFEHFEQDRHSYELSVTDDDLAQLRQEADNPTEATFLDGVAGRQVLHVTYGSLLSNDKLSSGQTRREAVLAALERHDDLHQQYVERHLKKHLQLLESER